MAIDRRLRRTISVLLPILALIATAGCGGDAASGDDVADYTERGPITYAAGKDTTGYLGTILERWNKEHPDERVRLIELPDEADQQRQQMIQNAQIQSDTFTVLKLDVVWTSEFAANQWIDEIPKDQFDTDDFVPATVDSATYFDRLYAVPMTSNGGLLFYRTDLLEQAGIDEPPETWEEMFEACDKIKAEPGNEDLICYGGQFNKYEGLTVNFSEAVDSAGGSILSEDGRKVTVDSPEAEAGLDFLVSGLKDGYIDPGELTWTEEEGRNAFQNGQLIFHRNWPYIWAQAEADDGSSKVNGKIDVAPLPGLKGQGVSTLGGANLGINKYARNKGTAIDFIKYMVSEEVQRERVEKTSEAPTIASVYEDEKLREQYPFLDELQVSIETAKSRPKAIKYGDLTLAVQDQAYAALQGDLTPDQALSNMAARLGPLVEF